MCLLFVSELEKNLLSLRVLETLTVALEEPVRSSFAADANHQSLTGIDPLREAIRPLGKEAVCRPFEEEKGWPRLELRILFEQLFVPSLQGAEMFAFLVGKPLKQLSPMPIARDQCCPRVKLEAASLSGDGNAQRIACKQQLGRSAINRRGLACSAFFACAVNLQHALTLREIPGSRDLFNDRLNVGAQEFERPVAGLADQMEMARMTVGMLE